MSFRVYRDDLGGIWIADDGEAVLVDKVMFQRITEKIGSVALEDLRPYKLRELTEPVTAQPS